MSADNSTAIVVYLDWGMIIPMPIGPEHLRRLPNEFYIEPVCSVMCHLDGVPDTDDAVAPDVIAQCISLLSEIEYDVVVNGYDSTTGGKVRLSVNGNIINDQIRLLLTSTVDISIVSLKICRCRQATIRHEHRLDIDIRPRRTRRTVSTRTHVECRRRTESAVEFIQWQ
jgi:hypothetical protein